MPDLLNVTYAQTGTSTQQNAMGMREMQARAYEKRDSQFLLIKAPPASGKSRALMFLALDKIYHQGLRKAIVAVPEMSIGGSFKDTDLVSSGFFTNWHIEEKYNLCTPGDEGKVNTVVAFLKDKDAKSLLCTHATIRFVWEKIHERDIDLFNGTVVAIDEFHHSSAEEGNKLGEMVDDIMTRTTAHLVAMTGSYFRGDQVPILSPETEAKFSQVTYTYYEQLNGYRYLKSLGLGYHFYQGRYIDAIAQVLDLSKKTIVHIPNVNSRESTGLKLNEVDALLDIIGTVESKDAKTGIMTVRAKSGHRLKVADLVSDTPERVNVVSYLRSISKRNDMDIIIALGMAKEGFDWPWCEHVLTVGYRSSMTEVVQIIGRATRDCKGKTHAQFTNLIAQPDAEDRDVRNSVNNLLKAIALSLLMRDVLAPNITFRPRSTMKAGEKLKPEEIELDDTEHPVSKRVKKILEDGGVQKILQTFISKPKAIAPAVISNDSKTATEIELPKVISTVYPNLEPEEADVLHKVAKAQLALQLLPKLSEAEGDTNIPILNIKKSRKREEDREKPSTGTDFIKLGEKFINVDDLTVDLIDKVNPFQGAYEIISKSFDAPTLRTIQDYVAASRSTMTEEEAVMLWGDIKAFAKEHGKPPSLSSSDAFERRLAEGLAYIRIAKQRSSAS